MLGENGLDVRDGRARRIDRTGRVLAVVVGEGAEAPGQGIHQVQAEHLAVRGDPTRGWL